MKFPFIHIFLKCYSRITIATWFGIRRFCPRLLGLRPRPRQPVPRALGRQLLRPRSPRLTRIHGAGHPPASTLPQLVPSEGPRMPGTSQQPPRPRGCPPAEGGQGLPRLQVRFRNLGFPGQPLLALDLVYRGVHTPQKHRAWAGGRYTAIRRCGDQKTVPGLGPGSLQTSI